ncbi:MAG: MATE family efflux transporter [Clostridiales bacterium]|nr:MATE family efflux transporter [Clostridiales bacterium]
MDLIKRIKDRYLGDRGFYSAVLMLFIPIVIQNGISSFVNLLDNLMVGSVGEAQMNGVSISNQLFFVFNLCIFGGMSGAGIFAAQFFGAKDEKGVKDCFRFMLLVALVICLAGTFVIGVFGSDLLDLFINPDLSGTEEEIAQEILKAKQTKEEGLKYIAIILLGLAPFALTNAYASTLRVEGETRLPMYAGIAGVFTNLTLNWLLIFDHFGHTGLGVQGAAIATVISRYVELSIIVVVAYRRLKKTGRYSFLNDAFRHFHIPPKLFKDVLIRSLPLLANELLWSVGMTVLTRHYSLRGLTVINAMTITSTISNLFNVLVFSMGTAVSVMVGRSLGANDMEGAKANARKIIVFCELICLVTCALLIILSNILPLAYSKSSDEAKKLASHLLRANAIVMPLNAFTHCTYFTLRAGGKTFITFLFDSVYTWLLPVPLSFFLVTFTNMDIVPIVELVHAMELIKVTVGYILLKKGIWIHNIVENQEA